jgi:hypothetical protein
MTDSYIHLGDFEKFVRNRFKHIINGKGSIIPRIAIKIALDDIFKNNIQDEPDLEKLGYCPRCGIRPCDCENLFGEEKAG